MMVYLYAYLAALHPERKTRRYRILSVLVAPVLATVGVVLLWPFGLVMKLQDMAAQRYRAKREEADTFKLKAADLLEPMSLADIEHAEFDTSPSRHLPPGLAAEPCQWAKI
jgi:hypothetical protein